VQFGPMAVRRAPGRSSGRSATGTEEGCLGLPRQPEGLAGYAVGTRAACRLGGSLAVEEFHTSLVLGRAGGVSMVVSSHERWSMGGRGEPGRWRFALVVPAMGEQVVGVSEGGRAIDVRAERGAPSTTGDGGVKWERSRVFPIPSPYPRPPG
jgi:hypothetical protein